MSLSLSEAELNEWREANEDKFRMMWNDFTTSGMKPLPGMPRIVCLVCHTDKLFCECSYQAFKLRVTPMALEEHFRLLRPSNEDTAANRKAQSGGFKVMKLP